MTSRIFDLPVLSLYPLLFFLAPQPGGMSSCYLVFFFLTSRSQTARRQIHRHPYRLIVMLYLYQSIFSFHPVAQNGGCL